MFRFGPESALLGQKIQIIQIRKRAQSFFVSFLLDIGTFVECLWNVCGTFEERLLLYCFDVTGLGSAKQEKREGRN